MLIFIIFICVFAATYAFGYIVVNLFISNSSYEERVISSIGVEKLAHISNFISPSQLYQMTIVLVAFLFLMGLLLAQGNIIGGILLGIIMAVPGFLLPSMLVSYLVSKRMEKINEELPGVLEVLSSSIFAGLTLNQAISRNIDKMPPEIASEFKIIANECRLGTSLNEAMKHWAERNTMMDVKLTVIASELALRHGGNLADTYRKLAGTIRERYMFQKEIQTLTTEGRMQAIVMTMLPFIILFVMTLIRREQMLDFLSSSIGIAAVSLVLVMQIAAYFWIKKAITIDI